MTDSTTLGLIFDCDGTLVDSMDAWRSVEDQLAKAAGVTLTKADTDLITELTIPEVGELFHSRFGVGASPKDVITLIDDAMYDFYCHKCSLKPGVQAFVEGMANLGAKMSVASSTPPKLLNAAMDHVGLTPYMTTILSVDDVGQSKRSPLIYERAQEAMGTKRELTWGFEDALYALKTLKAAGYPTLAIYDCDLSGTYEDLKATADKTITSFNQLSPNGFKQWALARV